MPLADYSHWNEEAPRIWWEEEGRHPYEPQEPDDDRPYDEYELADHDDSGDECIAQGDMSTRDGENWMCDGCEGDLTFVRDEDGKFKVKS